MMGRVTATAATTSEVTAPGDALRRFAAGLRWRHVCGRASSSALRALLALSVPAVLLVWWTPSLTWSVVIAASVVFVPVVAWSALRAWWRSRRVLAAFGESLAQPGSELAGVRDELVTWLEFDGRGETGGMLQWLERDVRERLRPHERAALAAVARPSIGRWRWLVPVLLLVLLAWLLSAWLQPPWPGALGGAPDQASGDGQGNGKDGGGAPDEREQGGDPQRGDDEASDEPPQRELPERPEEAPPPPLPPQDEREAQTEAPAPLLELPEQRRFVLPEYIGDGPTRRARMRAAELEQQVGGGAPTASRQRGGDERAPEPPKPEPETFERAAEQALRARHVPEHERAIVRRFFEKLQQAGKDD